MVLELGKDQKLVAASLNKAISKAHADEWSKGTAKEWAVESNEKAKNVVYNFDGESGFIDDHGGQGERLDNTYDQRALPVVREQLSKTGVRLAKMLNETFR